MSQASSAADLVDRLDQALVGILPLAHVLKPGAERSAGKSPLWSPCCLLPPVSGSGSRAGRRELGQLLVGGRGRGAQHCIISSCSPAAAGTSVACTKHRKDVCASPPAGVCRQVHALLFCAAGATHRCWQRRRGTRCCPVSAQSLIHWLLLSVGRRSVSCARSWPPRRHCCRRARSAWRTGRRAASA